MIRVLQGFTGANALRVLPSCPVVVFGAVRAFGNRSSGGSGRLDVLPVLFCAVVVFGAVLAFGSQ